MNILGKTLLIGALTAFCASSAMAQTTKTSRKANTASAKQFTLTDRAGTAYTKAVKTISNSELNLTSAKAVKTLDSNTIYVITGNVSLGGGTLQLGNGTCLKMMGGSISNGTIQGNGSIIDAPEYRIFYGNVKIAGNFANAFPVEWWGAAASSSVDSAPAINSAIRSGVNNLVAHGSEYYINSTILLNRSDVSLHFDGNVVARGGITAFNVYWHNISLKIHKLISEKVAKFAADNSGLQISDNCFLCDFNIHSIQNFGKGFNLRPRKNIVKEFSGIQYCKFTFQELVNIENIVFDLDSSDNGSGLWINENQFFGGRVGGIINGKYCDYGLRFYGCHSNEKYDWVNGNVFYCIGFEAVNHPIYGLWRWTADQFHDLRMSESITDKTYIQMGKCKFLNFTTKSQLYVWSEKTDKCTMSISIDKDCDRIIFEDTEYIHFADKGVLKSYLRKNILGNQYQILK